MKKQLSLVMVLFLLLPMASGLSEIEIAYPSKLQKTEGEGIILEKTPERIVCLSNSALQILVRCGLKPIAAPKTLSSDVDYPDWVKELPRIDSGMNTLDTESIIALAPDLVILGIHQKEKFGHLLQAAGLVVYYTSEGPSVTYEEVKEEALAISAAFGGDDVVSEIKEAFANVEGRAQRVNAAYPKRRMMILFSVAPFYQQTSDGYLGSMLAMLPYENLSDDLIGVEARTAPLDIEQLIALNPEVLFCVSPTAPKAAVLKTQYDTIIQENPGMWEQLSAYNENRMNILSNEFVTSKGIHVINSLNTLMDMLEENQ
ncbi:MAG: ABC transporter substrate-binding protein [Christensenellales bacterium]